MGVDRPFSEPFVRDRISNGEEASESEGGHVVVPDLGNQEADGVVGIR